MNSFYLYKNNELGAGETAKWLAWGVRGRESHREFHPSGNGIRMTKAGAAGSGWPPDTALKEGRLFPLASPGQRRPWPPRPWKASQPSDARPQPTRASPEVPAAASRDLITPSPAHPAHAVMWHFNIPDL